VNHSLSSSTLDRGEAEVIALVFERAAGLVLIDLTHGAQGGGVITSDFIRFCRNFDWAKQMGEISAVKQFLEEMMQRGIRDVRDL
jgi:predicted nucleic acid-binding protein